MSDKYSKDNYNFKNKDEIVDHALNSLNKLDIEIKKEDLEVYDVKKWKFSQP